MRLLRHSTGDPSTRDEQVEVESDTKRDKVPSLSLAVVLCKSVADVPLSDANIEGTSSCSGSSCCPADLCTSDLDGFGWDCLPAPALAVIGPQLPAKSLASARAACKAWSAHLSEALTQTSPSTYMSAPTQSAGSSPVIMQLMREGAKCGQKNNHQRFVQKLDSLNRHTGLQAALQEQLQHSLASWQDSLSKLLHACPFLTKLDLSKCAAILSADDYDKLMSANSTQHTHPCAGAVMRQRHLPVNVELLLPMLQPLTCLRHISFQLCKLSEKSIQMISWAMKVRWPNKPSSLKDIHISFAPPEELFLGYPTLPINTEDVIELTIYNGITHVNIANQAEVSDMAVAALSLLPLLTSMSLSGTALSNLGMYVITTSKSLTRLDLSKNPGITNQGVASLSRLRNLVSLDLSDCNSMSDPSLLALSSGLPLLQELSLHNCAHITDTGVTALQNSTSLTSLNLAVCRELTDAAVAALASLPKLSSLDMTFCDHLTDAVVPHLARMAGLQDLTLACCKLSSAGVAACSSLQGLTSLDLVGCVDGVTPEAAAALSKVSTLKSLNLAFCSMLMDSGVQALAGLTMLTDLSLAYCKWVTDDGISALSTLTALTSLNLQGCSQKAPHMSAHGLAALKHMTSLVQLNLGSCKLAPDAMQALSDLTQLTELSLRFGKGIVGSELANIGVLHRLERLDLRGCPGLSDATLTLVQNLHSLRSLDISYNKQLTDKGMLALTGPKALQHLAVTDCPGVSEACLDALLVSVPSIRSLSNSDSYDAEQVFSMHGFRSRTCYLPAMAIDNIPADVHHHEE